MRDHAADLHVTYEMWLQTTQHGVWKRGTYDYDEAQHGAEKRMACDQRAFDPKAIAWDDDMYVNNVQGCVHKCIIGYDYTLITKRVRVVRVCGVL